MMGCTSTVDQFMANIVGGETGYPSVAHSNNIILVMP